MEGSQRQRRRSRIGGILSLARFADDHSEAIEYDLMTKTQYTLDDIGGALPWRSLSSFIKNLDSGSALARDLGKSTGWEDTIRTNAILADIYDLLQRINSNIVAIGDGKPTKNIKPYPRPGRDEDNTRKIGKGGLPVDELREWIRRRRNG